MIQIARKLFQFIASTAWIFCFNRDFCPVSACTDKHTAVLGGRIYYFIITARLLYFNNKFVGVDVVSFFKLPNNSYPGVAGVYPYVSVYNGYSFLFSSVENMDLFNANPTSYLPQYGGKICLVFFVQS